ncbi:MAG: FAD-dependent monooxygenase, partial [Chloroflexota bacterium]
MRIVCVGGGPGGLYAAILLKKSHLDWQIEVYERNRPDDTYGWGVVFSDQTMNNLKDADQPTYNAIVESFYHWDDIEVFYKGGAYRSGGHGFSGLGRMRLLMILQQRAAELGVDLHFETEVNGLEQFADADLIIAGDGVNSRIRTTYADAFQPDITMRRCKYIWLGCYQHFDAFTFAFKETEWGWFQIHAYQFNDEMSTVIVETPEENWHAAGLGELTAEESIKFCEDLFAEYLGGHELISNATHMKNPWINFKHIVNGNWIHDNILLLGDAAHTAHFSIGSGTKLALEDAIALDKFLREYNTMRDALQAYEDERKIEVIKIQSAARNSTEWFEHVDRYTEFEGE